MSTPPSVVRVWAPVFLAVMMGMFLQHAPPAFWILALPVLALSVFMATLAEIHDEGRGIRVKSLWRSWHVPEEDVLRTDESFLEGIGVLRLRGFVFPWGRIYFVREWSATQPAERYSTFWDPLVSAALAMSGFIAARAVSGHGLRIGASHARTLLIVLAGALCLLFAVTRKKKPSFASGMLFVAGYVVGLARW